MKLYFEGNTSEVLSNMGKKVLKQYLEALAALSSALSKQLGKYDMYSMIAGMVFVFQVKDFYILMLLSWWTSVSSHSPERKKKTCNINIKLRERWNFYVNTAKFNVKDASEGKSQLSTMMKEHRCMIQRCINDLLSPSLSSLCSGHQAPDDLTAGYAWSPQRWSSCRSPSRLSAAVPALLPSVSAARFRACVGLHVCYELLLLLHPLLGPCVRGCRILLSNVLYSDLHGSASTLPGTQL